MPSIIFESFGNEESIELDLTKASEKEIKEAKSKSELEKLMQQRISEKDTEILNYKKAIKKEIKKIA